MTNGILIYGKYLRISSFIRKPFRIYDFASAPLWISLNMRKIYFSFLSVYNILLRCRGQRILTSDSEAELTQESEIQRVFMKQKEKTMCCLSQWPTYYCLYYYVIAGSKGNLGIFVDGGQKTTTPLKLVESNLSVALFWSPFERPRRFFPNFLMKHVRMFLDLRLCHFDFFILQNIRICQLLFF